MKLGDRASKGDAQSPFEVPMGAEIDRRLIWTG